MVADGATVSLGRIVAVSVGIPVFVGVSDGVLVIRAVAVSVRVI